MISENFLKERNKAILSLDKSKIIEYMKKYNIKIPDNEVVFWAGVHKAILNLNAATKEQKDDSYKWLLKNDFNPMLKPKEG